MKQKWMRVSIGLAIMCLVAFAEPAHALRLMGITTMQCTCNSGNEWKVRATGTIQVNEDDAQPATSGLYVYMDGGGLAPTALDQTDQRTAVRCLLHVRVGEPVVHALGLSGRGSRASVRNERPRGRRERTERPDHLGRAGRDRLCAGRRVSLLRQLATYRFAGESATALGGLSRACPCREEEAASE